MLERLPTTAQVSRTWRWVRWRTLVVGAVFLCGLAAFLLGADVSDRPGVPEASLLTKLYYTLSLFVLGGTDLGVPSGGSAGARTLLWGAYFVAPAVTATAVIEGVLRAVRPDRWALRRMRGHLVLAGCGKLGLQVLRRIRERAPRIPVVVVDARPDNPNLELARDVFGAHVVVGDVSHDAVLAACRLAHADHALLLVGDDFINLDTAAKVLQLAPRLRGRLVVHVADLRFVRVMADTRLAEDVTIFNTHQIAACHLVETKLLEHFHRTEPLDTVVIAGFGRFGQTVLDELQKRAAGKFERVLIIDLSCRQRVAVFEEQVGFQGTYRRHAIDGDLSDPVLWRELDERHRLGDCQPAFMIGSGDDGTNLQVAMWLHHRHPQALVVARTFRRSAFAQEVSREGGFEVFEVAELVTESIPDDWFM